MWKILAITLSACVLTVTAQPSMYGMNPMSGWYPMQSHQWTPTPQGNRDGDRNNDDILRFIIAQQVLGNFGGQQQIQQQNPMMVLQAIAQLMQMVSGQRDGNRQQDLMAQMLNLDSMEQLFKAYRLYDTYTEREEKFERLMTIGCIMHHVLGEANVNATFEHTDDRTLPDLVEKFSDLSDDQIGMEAWKVYNENKDQFDEISFRLTGMICKVAVELDVAWKELEGHRQQTECKTED